MHLVGSVVYRIFKSGFYFTITCDLPCGVSFGVEFQLTVLLVGFSRVVDGSLTSVLSIDRTCYVLSMMLASLKIWLWSWHSCSGMRLPLV